MIWPLTDNYDVNCTRIYEMGGQAKDVTMEWIEENDGDWHKLWRVTYYCVDSGGNIHIIAISTTLIFGRT